jgi:phosphoribosylanthranilate isomerase
MGITHRTQDAVSPEDAAKMVATLPPFIEPVAVTHLQEADPIIAILQRSRCTTLQIQNTIAPDEVAAVRDALPYVHIIKAVHVVDELSIETAVRMSAFSDAIILDTRTADRLGGTGIPHDWNISATIVKSVDIPVLLAGGLTPQNVIQAIERVHPYGVDVHTGVKNNGIRDAEKTRAFVEAAHKYT